MKSTREPQTRHNRKHVNKLDIILQNLLARLSVVAFVNRLDLRGQGIWVHSAMHKEPHNNPASGIDGAAIDGEIEVEDGRVRGLVGEAGLEDRVSSMIHNKDLFSAAFDEEVNFCAGASQFHTHSPTCVKYSINRPARTRILCSFKAPWKLVERTGFTQDDILQIRHRYSLVNRWYKAIATGLRYNYDYPFIGIQSKTLAVVFYVTNYATKLEDPVWKQAAVAAEALSASSDFATAEGAENRTRQFLVKVANMLRLPLSLAITTPFPRRSDRPPRSHDSRHRIRYTPFVFCSTLVSTDQTISRIQDWETILVSCHLPVQCSRPYFSVPPSHSMPPSLHLQHQPAA
jgi:hypothetical protein